MEKETQYELQYFAGPRLGWCRLRAYTGYTPDWVQQQLAGTREDDPDATYRVVRRTITRETLSW